MGETIPNIQARVKLFEGPRIIFFYILLFTIIIKIFVGFKVQCL